MIKKLISDGVLVSTPAGSTAYNLSVHGPILSLNSKKLAITPILGKICVFINWDRKSIRKYQYYDLYWPRNGKPY